MTIGGSTNVLGENTADNAFDSSTVVSNADGSVLERLEYLQSIFPFTERTVAVSVDEVSADIIDVAGGPILITNCVGIVTAAIGANATTCKLVVDRDDGAADTELTTAVAITSDVVGTIYVFTAANPSVLTPLTPGANGSSSLMTGGWFVPEGMLEQVMSADPGGAAGDHITWYITYKPLVAGVTVTAQ